MAVASVPVHSDQSTRLSTFEGIRVREDTAYCNARGKEKSRIRKKAEKSLRELKDTIIKILGPDEAVLYIAHAQALPSKLEEFFLGWLAYATHRGILVLTNQRLIYFITDKNGRWQKSVRVARWADIEKAKAGGLISHVLRLKYRDGVTEVFYRLSGGDTASLKRLLGVLQPASVGETSPALGMVHLCPYCLVPLRSGIYQCGKCGARFKDEKTLARRALIIPALGYAYIGHPGLAVLDFIIEALLLFEIGARLIVAAQMMMLPHVAAQANDALMGLWIQIAVFAAGWLLKRWLMMRQCTRFVREFIPAEGPAFQAEGVIP
jgi:hypothetical protein